MEVKRFVTPSVETIRKLEFEINIPLFTAFIRYIFSNNNIMSYVNIRIKKIYSELAIQKLYSITNYETGIQR